MSTNSRPRGDEPTKSPRVPPRASAFDIPPSLKRLFNRFPLYTYPSNSLPLRSPQQRDRHTLYVFTTPEDAASGAPSFNPGCLKWQTYLHIANIPFHTRPSNNHASPSGALPFMIPAAQNDTIPSSRLTAWTTSTSSARSESTPIPALASRQESYLSLLSHSIRLAYLAVLYLDQPTFTSTAKPLYIDSASSSAPVQVTLSYSLRAAALGEVLSASNARGAAQVSGGLLGRGVLDGCVVERLLEEADEAFDAISVLLGEAEYFGQVNNKNKTEDASEREEKEAEEEQEQETSGARNESGTPNMLDAAVFAYTHAISLLFGNPDREFQGETTPAQCLARSVRKRRNLMRHRKRILDRYYDKSTASMN